MTLTSTPGKPKTPSPRLPSLIQSNSFHSIESLLFGSNLLLVCDLVSLTPDFSFNLASDLCFCSFEKISFDVGFLRSRLKLKLNLIADLEVHALAFEL